MSLVPCPHCNQPLGDDEMVCADCGRRSDEPVGASAAEPAHPTPAAARTVSTRTVLLAGVAVAALGAAAYEFVVRRAARPQPAPAAQTAVARTAAPLPLPFDHSATAPSTAAPAAAAPPPSAPSATPQTEYPEEQEAELPPVPADALPGRAAVYGVVYDLSTKRPVKDATIVFTGALRVPATTDAHGWYRVDVPVTAGAPEYMVSVSAPGHHQGALQERDPPLASLSDVDRRTIAEEDGDPPDAIKISLGSAVHLAELDLALVPLLWPAGMPPAELSDAQAPPVPDEPDERTCRYYGVVYDLATKKPMRHADLRFESQGGGSPRRAATDGKGRYVMDIPVIELDSEPTVTAALSGYRTGLLAERDPPLLEQSLENRAALAATIDLAFDPVVLPDDCDEGLVRLDLSAVPQTWPER